ncbi:hypothetical protein TOTORO_03220 [Serratia phage vB_SmaS-Totoro]|nr:hypothetical protein TOTORO_03220 [Serratia phage vB_SmaS-Totoro]
MSRVQELMSMFVQLYRTVLPNKDIRKIIHDLNNGLCYFVSTEIAIVLHREGYVVAYQGHCHHCWLNFEGKDYDTMYPEGYPRNVAEEWQLDLMGFGTSCSTTRPSGKPETEDFCHSHYAFQVIQRLWRNLHGIAQPEKVKKPLPSNRYYRRRIDARAKKASQLIYHLEPLPTGVMVPFTHYTWDTVAEEDLSRPLVLHPLMRSVTAYKFLFKDYRVNGTPIQSI